MSMEQYSVSKSRELKEVDELDLRDLVLYLMGYWKLILGTAFGFAVIAALWSLFVMTPKYESYAVIAPSKAGGGERMLSALEGAGLGSLLSMSDLNEQLTRYVEILGSRTLIRNMIREENLLDRFGVTIEDPESLEGRKTFEQLVNRLKGSAQVAFEPPVIRLAYVDPDPVLARDMVNLYIKHLQKFVSQNAVSEAKNAERFIAERIEEVEQSLQKAEAEYVKLHQKEGVFQLPTQLGFSLSTVSQLRAQLIEKDLEIALYRDVMKDAGQVELLEDEKKQIEAQIAKLIEGERAAGKPKHENVLTPLKQGPSLSLEFADVERNYLAQVKILEILKQQYELARIESKKEEILFHVIDEAAVGIWPVSPRKKLNTALGFLLGIFLTVSILFIRFQFQSQPIRLDQRLQVDVRSEKTSARA